MRLRAGHPRDHVLGVAQDSYDIGFLHRRRRYHGFPEWAGDCRRLHVGSDVAWPFQPDFRPRVRWHHLLHRLLRRLAIDSVSDGGAPAQFRTLYLRRYRDVPAGRVTYSVVVCVRLLVGCVFLPDRTDGRRGPVDQAAVRTRLHGSGNHGRRLDDAVRDLRRNAGDDMGANYQGCFVTVGGYRADGFGVRSLWF
ncbi:hypothetical protein D3C87_1479430 [compost metagenome]